MSEQASIADVQALEDLIDSMPDLHRASIERALDAKVQARVDDETGGMIDADDHEVVVAARDAAEMQVEVLTSRIEVLERELQGLREKAA